MNQKPIATAVAAAILAAAGAPVAFAQGAEADEIAQLRAQLESLQQKLEQLERRQAETTETQERALDTLAKTRADVGEWVTRFTWKGDVRYRNEQFDIEGVPRDRIRDRIRVRGGFVAKINDSWNAEVQLATGGADPRGSNQTLDGLGSRKDFGLDLGYVEWKPNALWKLTLGKQRQPWVKPGQSFFFDGDINPEGVAATFTHGSGVFADAFHFWLQERGAGADSELSGAQLGWRSAASSRLRFTVGAGYYDFGAVKGYALLAPSTFNPFGNSTNTVTASSRFNCRPSVGVGASCLLNDYDLVQLFGEAGFTVAGIPVTVFADLAQNGEADAEDMAWGAGATVGRVSGSRTWEVGYAYQDVEKDALLGQFVDSDFGDGNTDTRGSVLRFGYGVARNFSFNASYYLNELNVSGLSGGLRGRDYRRLQLDLSFRF